MEAPPEQEDKLPQEQAIQNMMGEPLELMILMQVVALEVEQEQLVMEVMVATLVV